ncbi:short chain dehydrogenase, putative [Medicago truncatula]|uniref:Short chain dehydrogenase, putative n=1 Tax=Medicago truncatula TaxID=3880 RepID=A0A072TER2_MEDTR|nr:short chain dehydrogenase, putative [Medicago truncatula]
MGGHTTMPGIAYYCGSKFALEGISEAAGKELEPFGIAVTAVAPGSFRTDWAGRSMMRTPRSIADYDAIFDPIRQAREERSGKQPGDPRCAAARARQTRGAGRGNPGVGGGDGIDGWLKGVSRDVSCQAVSVRSGLGLLHQGPGSATNGRSHESSVGRPGVGSAP